MDNKNSHSDKNWELTPEMIQAYHAGTLSAEKMHWVERQLLDDEFAADAFEGVTNVEALPDILGELEQRIDKRIERDDTKVIPFRFKAWQIAASLSLLIIASYFIFNSFTPSQETLALEEKTIQAPNKITKKNELTDNDDQVEKTKNSPNSENEPLERKEQVKTKEIVSSHDSTPAKPIIEPAEIVSIEMDDMITEDAEIAEIIAEEETTVEYKKEDQKQLSDKLTGKAAGIEVSKEKAKSARVKKRVQSNKVEADDVAFLDSKDSKIITGKVIDTDGIALPGVNIIIKGTSTGVITDFDGKFSIPSVTENDLLTISFIGYNSKDIKVSDSETLNIILEENASALSEVVVVGYGTSQYSESNTYQSASPVGGTSAYKKYLEKNIRYPKFALDRKVEGKVKIIFFVEPNGTLTNFEVKKSLGYGCDEEAIRLIKEGPGWTAAERDNGTFRQKASVTIRFKLEE